MRHLYLSKPLGTVEHAGADFQQLHHGVGGACGATRQHALARATLGGHADLRVCVPGVKFVEYKDKWEEGLLTGQSYRPESRLPARSFRQALELSAGSRRSRCGKVRIAGGPCAACGEIRHREIDDSAGRDRSAGNLPPVAVQGEPRRHAGVDRPRTEQRAIFFGIYFVMTGLHGVHVLARHGGDRLASWFAHGVASSARSTSTPWTSPAFTGTWWIWCGSSFSHCFI